MSKKLTITLVIIVLCIGGFLGWKKLRSDHDNKTQNTPTETSQSSNQEKETINNTPATEEEKSNSEQKKIETDNSQQAPATDQSTGKIKATVTITEANSGVIGSFASGVVEDGGKCTATLTQGTKSFTKAVDAIANVSYAQCGRIFLQPSDFPAKGEWSVTVHYESAAATGTSPVTTFTVE